MQPYPPDHYNNGRYQHPIAQTYQVPKKKPYLLISAVIVLFVVSVILTLVNYVLPQKHAADENIRSKQTVTAPKTVTRNAPTLKHNNEPIAPGSISFHSGTLEFFISPKNFPRTECIDTKKFLVENYLLRYHKNDAIRDNQQKWTSCYYDTPESDIGKDRFLISLDFATTPRLDINQPAPPGSTQSIFHPNGTYSWMGFTISEINYLDSDGEAREIFDVTDQDHKELRAQCFTGDENLHPGDYVERIYSECAGRLKGIVNAHLES